MSSLLLLLIYVVQSCLTTIPWGALAEVQLTLRGRAILNNTVIRIDEIGENDAALICHTNLYPCCSTPPHRHGEWYYPDGSLVPNSATGQDFYRGRGNDGVVRLNRRNNAQSPIGIYACEIPDNEANTQRLTVGVASQDAYPIIVEHPKDALQVDPGSDVTFSVLARLSTGYIWKLNQTNLVDSVKYTGSRTSSLTIHNVQHSDEGEYTCVVGNQLVSIISGRARLTLLQPPVILVQPEEMLGVSPGEEVSFVVAIRGSRVSYNWEYENGTALPDESRFEGRSTSTLTIFDVRQQDSGVLICYVSNTAGSVHTKPVQLNVGRLYIVESVDVIPEITSALVTWIPPQDIEENVEVVILFQLEYYPVMFPGHHIVLNTTNTSHHAVGLIPLIEYQFRVRLVLPTSPSKWVTTTVTLQEHIPAVQNLRHDLKSGVLVIEWDPFTPALLGWNVSHYKILYEVYPVDDSQVALYTNVQVVPGDTFLYSIIVDEIPVEPNVQYRIQVNAAIDTKLEGIETIEGEKSVVVTSLDLGEGVFQVVLGPVEHCITWNVKKAAEFELQIKEAIRKAILHHCECSFQLEQLSNGVFSCRTQPNVVTYRSSITGNNVTELVLHLEEWVKSKTTIILDWFLVDVYSSCSVRLNSLNEPECNPFKPATNVDNMFTFSTNDSAVANCINMCYK